jgi:hypothetical protein
VNERRSEVKWSNKLVKKSIVSSRRRIPRRINDLMNWSVDIWDKTSVYYCRYRAYHECVDQSSEARLMWMTNSRSLDLYQMYEIHNKSTKIIKFITHKISIYSLTRLILKSRLTSNYRFHMSRDNVIHCMGSWQQNRD